jgi:hypothetical protein
MKKANCFITLLICCLAYQSTAHAQANNSLSHLTIYSANLAEYLEERTVELQPGYNTVEWRSLMPKANIRTVRVLAEDAEVVRQDVTYDGAQVNSEKSPVLHLLIQNRGAAGRKRIQVDYLAPNLTWRGDYSLVIEPTGKDQAPTAATIDSWVSLQNNTGVDIGAGTVDLVAGEIALLSGDSDNRRQYASQMTMNSNISIGSEEESTETSAAVSSLSAFNRFTLGNDIKLNANSPISRFPIFQHARLNIVQRIVFENEYNTQTFGRGDFILLPRGLEVRLVAKNTASAPMAAGLVTIYQRQGPLSQIVGQDRIAFTPQNSEFTVSQGLSAVIFGTRRILEHRAFSYVEANRQRDKLMTKVEVVLTNRGTQPAEAFVRENIEKHGDNQWKIIESSTPNETIGANSVQFKVSIPAGGKVTIIYAVECE